MLGIGYEPREELRGSTGTAAQVAFGVAAVALSFFVWRLKAWALLLLQALLGITALASFVGLIIAQTTRGAILTLALMLITGALFYKLVRVLARAQTPRDAVPPDDGAGAPSQPSDPS
jgi:hypothetical protein